MDINILLKTLYTIILVTVPAAMVGGGIFLAMRTFIRRDHNMRVLELKVASNKETLLLRLQAYERMALFLERISPAVINHELQLAVIRAIRSEFEHNLSQQIYISSDAWTLIVSAKDELIKAIGMIAAQVPADATGQQVGRVILESIAQSGQSLPTQTALEFLKNEVREMM